MSFITTKSLNRLREREALRRVLLRQQRQRNLLQRMKSWPWWFQERAAYRRATR
jgi:hypothetical protein